MKQPIINWPALKKSKPHMIGLFLLGFFAIVGAIQFITALLKFIF